MKYRQTLPTEADNLITISTDRRFEGEGELAEITLADQNFGSAYRTTLGPEEARCVAEHLERAADAAEGK